MNKLLAPHDRRIPASYWLAVVVGCLAVLVCFATARWVPWFVFQAAETVPRPLWGAGASLLGVTLGLIMVSAPLLALRWTWFGLCIAIAPVAVTLLDPDGVGFDFGMFVAVGCVAVAASWRRPLAAAAAVLSGIGLAWWWVESRQRLAAPFDADVQILDHGQAAQLGTVYTVVFLLVLGGALLLRRSALREEERRALQARAGEVEGQAAVVAERARLARDLHDVVAHHVSLIAVRAETAPYTDPEIGEVGRRVLGDIAADARMALDELRGVLGILGRAGDAERAPQPTWSDISALVERSRAAGVDVRLQGETSAQVSVGPGYAAYRLVQEALTNARRHAPGEQVEVELAATGRLLSVRVVNGGAAAANIGGHGLVGMRERVEALGGRFRAGRENGSFVVEATLPQTATEDVA